MSLFLFFSFHVHNSCTITAIFISLLISVINELDGLARGNLEGHYDSVEHSDMVKENAKQAMAFLEEQFDQKNPRLRAQTTKGNMLDTIVYRSETTDTKVSFLFYFSLLLHLKFPNIHVCSSMKLVFD